MFNLSVWLRDNLSQSCRERSFTVAQVNIMAFNYFQKGQLSEDDFNTVVTVAREVEAEIIAEEEAKKRAEEEANKPPEDTTEEPIE